MKFQTGDRVRVPGYRDRYGVVAAVRDGRMTILLENGGEMNGPDDGPGIEFLGPAPDPSVKMPNYDAALIQGGITIAPNRNVPTGILAVAMNKRERF